MWFSHIFVDDILMGSTTDLVLMIAACTQCDHFQEIIYFVNLENRLKFSLSGGDNWVTMYTDNFIAESFTLSIMADDTAAAPKPFAYNLVYTSGSSACLKCE